VPLVQTRKNPAYRTCATQCESVSEERQNRGAISFSRWRENDISYFVSTKLPSRYGVTAVAPWHRSKLWRWAAHRHRRSRQATGLGSCGLCGSPLGAPCTEAERRNKAPIAANALFNCASGRRLSRRPWRLTAASPCLVLGPERRLSLIQRQCVAVARLRARSLRRSTA